MRAQDYDLLEWDSQFFGFKVARINAACLGESPLRDLLSTLKAHGVVLAYWSSDSEDMRSQEAAKASDGFLADEKITYERMLSGESVALMTGLEVEITEYIDTPVNGRLDGLAVQAGEFSRFCADPGIPRKKFVELYTLWVRGSLEKRLADVVFVARDQSSIVGFISAAVKDGWGDIGLLAVDKKFRRKKIGRGLIAAAEKWLYERDCKSVRVVTQKRNTAACRLYENCGYNHVSAKNLYHFWL